MKTFKILCFSILTLIAAPQFSFASAFISGPPTLSGAVATGCDSGEVIWWGQSDSSRAVILASGQCRNAQTVIIDKPYLKEYSIFIDNAHDTNFPTTRIIYATTIKQNFSLVEIASTYRDLKKMGIQIHSLSPEPITSVQEVLVVSGGTRAIEACTIVGVANRIRENGRDFLNSYKFDASKCTSIVGSLRIYRGSPIISEKSGAVLGMVFSGNENNGPACDWFNACEVDAQGRISVNPYAGYVLRSQELLNCIDENHQFNLHLGSCSLPSTQNYGSFRN